MNQDVVVAVDDDAAGDDDWTRDRRPPSRLTVLLAVGDDGCVDGGDAGDYVAVAIVKVVNVRNFQWMALMSKLQNNLPLKT